MEYGLAVWAAVFTTLVISRLWPDMADAGEQARRRNLAAVAYMVGMIIISGIGPTGYAMNISYRSEAALFDAVCALPPDALIAKHPRDAQGIPYWTGRAVTTNVETALPWQSRAWARRLEAMQETVAALYAPDRSEVLDYLRRSGATHVLLNRGRYKPDLVERAHVFEPVDGFIRKLLAGRAPERLVFANPPPSAVVFRQGPWMLIDARLLQKTWDSATKDIDRKPIE